MHFCSAEHAGDIHVSDVVWHSLAGAEDQLTSTAVRSARKWLSEAEEPYWAEDTEATPPDAGMSPGPGGEEETSRPSALRRPVEAEGAEAGSLGDTAKPKERAVKARPPRRSTEKEKEDGPPRKPAKRSRAGDGVATAAKEAKGKGVGNLSRPTSSLPPEKVQKLRDELERSKAKLAGGGPPDPPPEGDSPDGRTNPGRARATILDQAAQALRRRQA